MIIRFIALLSLTAKVPEIRCPSVNDVPDEVAFFLAVCDSMIGAAAVEHHSILQVRVECGIIDLAYHRRQFAKAQRDREFVIKASGYLDLEPALRTLDNLKCVPLRKAGLVNLDLGVAQVLEGPFLVGGAILEIPLGETTREDRDAHDFERTPLADLLLQIDVNPQRQRRDINQLLPKPGVDSLLQAADRQLAPDEKERGKTHIAAEEVGQDRRCDLAQVHAGWNPVGCHLGRKRIDGMRNANVDHGTLRSQEFRARPRTTDRTR